MSSGAQSSEAAQAIRPARRPAPSRARPSASVPHAAIAPHRYPPSGGTDRGTARQSASHTCGGGQHVVAGAALPRGSVRRAAASATHATPRSTSGGARRRRRGRTHANAVASAVAGGAPIGQSRAPKPEPRALCAPAALPSRAPCAHQLHCAPAALPSRAPCAHQLHSPSRSPG